MLSNEHRLEEAAFCQEADEDVRLWLGGKPRWKQRENQLNEHVENAEMQIRDKTKIATSLFQVRSRSLSRGRFLTLHKVSRLRTVLVVQLNEIMRKIVTSCSVS